MAGAMFGRLLGLVFGLPGLIVGPFTGVVLGELSTHRDLRRTRRVADASMIHRGSGREGRNRVHSRRAVRLQTLAVRQRARRSIGTTVGEVPAWIVPMISNPCRW